MSKIQQIKPDYRQAPEISEKKPKPNYANRQSFGSAASIADDTFNIAKKLTEKQKSLITETLIKSKGALGKFGSFLDRLSKTAGEVQNIWFIGFGTAIIAPIFIAFNPISKQDKETKIYSAMRQPLSAVIATAVGLGINQPIAKLFNKLSANGTLEKFNMSANPPTAYVKDRYKGIIKHFDKIKDADAKNLKGSLKADKEYLDLLENKKIKTVEDFKKEFDYRYFETQIKDKSAEKAAMKLLDASNPKNIRQKSTKQFLVEKFGFEADKVNEKILNPDITKTKLEKIKATEFLEKLGFDPDVYNEKNIRTFIHNEFYKERFLSESKNDKELAQAMFDTFKDITKKSGLEMKDQKALEKLFTEKLSKRGFDSLERKAITRLSEITIDSAKDNKAGKSLKDLLKVISAGEEDAAKTLDDVLTDGGKALDMKVDKFLSMLREKIDLKSAIESTRKLKDNEIPEKLLNKANEEFLLDCAKKFVKDSASNAENAFKAYSKLQGIILSLAVLPFSCGLLNWTYPRFMEKFFPKLAASKAQSKGGK